MSRSNWRPIIIAILLVANVFAGYVAYREWPRTYLTVAMLDVGQGDAIYIRTPRGNEVLIDGGPDRRVLRELGELMPFWDRTIDLLALSHPHADHLTGLVEVLRRFNSATVIEAAPIYSSPVYAAWYQELEKKDIPAILARHDGRLILDEGVTLTVLAPMDDYVGRRLANVHQAMVVLKLEYASTTFLFTGDLEMASEEALVAVTPNLSSTVLKVGHHGSKTSTGDIFLRAVSPQLALVSSGQGNKYGHPTADVLSRLTARGVKVFRTDKNGTVILESDGQRITARLEK